MSASRIITKATMPDIVRNMVSDYQDRDFFGKITLFFEHGKVTDIKSEENHRPDDLHDKYSRPRKQIVVRTTKADESAVVPEDIGESRSTDRLEKD